MEIKNKGIIICGFKGIGKSHMAYYGLSGIIDLDSTPFHIENEDYDIDYHRYITVANHMANNGYIVLLSFQEELRKILLSNNIDYLSVLPNKELKEEYINNYKKIGYDILTIDDINKNWDNYTTPLKNEKYMTLEKGEYIKDIMMDILNEIERININK